MLFKFFCTLSSFLKFFESFFIKLFNFFLLFLKRQLIISIVSFFFYIFYFKQSIGIAFNLSQPGMLNFLLDKPAQSYLTSCNSLMEAVIFTLIISGTVFTYNYLTGPTIVEPEETILIKSTAEIPVYGLTIPLKSAELRSNLDRDDLIEKVDKYQNQLEGWKNDILRSGAYYGEPLSKSFIQYPHKQHEFGRSIYDHTRLHNELLSHINTKCFTSGIEARSIIVSDPMSAWKRDIIIPYAVHFVEPPKLDISTIVPLHAVDLLTPTVVSKLCKTTEDNIGYLDYYWVILERMQQVHYKSFIPILPEILPTKPIVAYATKTTYAPLTNGATFGTRLEYFFLEAKKFFFSFFL